MLTVKEVADRLGVSSNTIRVWTKEFDAYLSPTAAPGPGKTRMFADDDIAVLWTVKALRAQGVPSEDIHAALANGERLEPLEGQNSRQEPPIGEDDSQRPTSAVSMALELVRGQIEGLQNERDYLRAELTTEREARIDAERRAATAEARAEMLERSSAPATIRPEVEQGGHEGDDGGQPKRRRRWWPWSKG